MLLVAHEAASVAAARKGMFEALCKEALPQDLATVLLRKEGSCDVTTKINDVRAWGLNRVCLAQQAAKKKKN
jgi:hypothetical protein